MRKKVSTKRWKTSSSVRSERPSNAETLRIDLADIAGVAQRLGVPDHARYSKTMGRAGG